MSSNLRLRDVFKKVALPAVLIGATIGVNVGIDQATMQQVDVTVQKVDSALMRKGEGFGFTKTIYETDQGTFKNTLSVLNSKFGGSRDAIERQLEVGKDYTLTTTGPNIPSLGIYPNILKVTPKAPGK